MIFAIIMRETFRANDRLFVYYSVCNIFSNFRWAPIRMGGYMFENNEKYIQFKKSEIFGDRSVSVRIMEMDNPYEIKKLAYTIKGFNKDRWDTELLEVALDCNRQKFQVHYDMAEFLMSTAPRHIAEASKEDPWGCGLSLWDDDIMDRDNWTRKNGTMGDVLMMIRGELLHERSQREVRRSSGISIANDTLMSTDV